MNILSFDIEEWSIEKAYGGGRKEKFAEFDRLLDHILEQLSTRSLKATFFCLGKMAVDFPLVIKKIVDEGHEIGSHSHAHKWINKMTPEEFRDDTRQAVYALEDITGMKVRSFRAPAFSIGESNKWALEILTEFGIENDASIFPGARDFGGFSNFTVQKPCIIEYDGIRINEFPIPLHNIPVVNKKIAYSGGGYFRLLPLWFVERCMRDSDYNMCYFHIDDLISDKVQMMSRKAYESYFKESGPLIKRLSRYFKANVGRSSSLNRMKQILDDFSFTSIKGYLERNNMDAATKV